MPIQNNVQEITITSVGGTVNLDVNSLITLYIIDGAATLSSNSTIQSIGTPILGTTFRFNYIANIDLNGYTITIFGETMPSTLADKSHNISATWNGSSWDVTFQASMDENASIPKEAVEGYSFSNKEELVTFPVSFESGEQGKSIVYFPYDQGFDIHGVWFSVIKNIEATDDGYITFYEDNGVVVMTNTYGTPIDIPAGSTTAFALGPASVDFTSNVSHPSSAYIVVETSKVTPGGKVLLTFLIRKQ